MWLVYIVKLDWILCEAHAEAEERVEDWAWSVVNNEYQHLEDIEYKSSHLRILMIVCY